MQSESREQRRSDKTCDTKMLFSPREHQSFGLFAQQNFGKLWENAFCCLHSVLLQGKKQQNRSTEIQEGTQPQNPKLDIFNQRFHCSTTWSPICFYTALLCTASNLPIRPGVGNPTPTSVKKYFQPRRCSSAGKSWGKPTPWHCAALCSPTPAHRPRLGVGRRIPAGLRGLGREVQAGGAAGTAQPSEGSLGKQKKLQSEEVWSGLELLSQQYCNRNADINAGTWTEV